MRNERPREFGVLVERQDDGLIFVGIKGDTFDDHELDWIMDAIRRVRQGLTDLVDEEVDR